MYAEGRGWRLVCLPRPPLFEHQIARARGGRGEDIDFPMITPRITGLALRRDRWAGDLLAHARDERRQLRWRPLVACRRHADEFDREALVDRHADALVVLRGVDADGDVGRRWRLHGAFIR